MSPYVFDHCSSDWPLIIAEKGAFDWQIVANSCKKCLKAGKVRSELKFKKS